jgi:hypothetical protein
MSYEGYTEYLCPNGHRWKGTDRYSDTDLANSEICSFCKEKADRLHHVCTTNGEKDADDDPKCHTRPAPIVAVGFDDNWKKDHYGNRYAEKVEKFEPVDNRHWIKLM